MKIKIHNSIFVKKRMECGRWEDFYFQKTKMSLERIGTVLLVRLIPNDRAFVIISNGFRVDLYTDFTTLKERVWTRGLDRGWCN